MFTKILMSLVVLIFASSAMAGDASVTFSDMQVRPSIAKVGVGFFTVTSTAHDTITAIHSDCCAAVELHRTEKLNGVMSMRRIAAFNLVKNKVARIQPDSKGGEHLMLIGLKEPLAEGDKVEVTFTFKKAPTQTVTFPVASEAPTSGVHELH
jgi:copper(I)-binding protein